MIRPWRGAWPLARHAQERLISMAGDRLLICSSPCLPGCGLPEALQGGGPLDRYIYIERSSQPSAAGASGAIRARPGLGGQLIGQLALAYPVCKLQRANTQG